MVKKININIIVNLSGRYILYEIYTVSELTV